jgi:hypothetical protein
MKGIRKLAAVVMLSGVLLPQLPATGGDVPRVAQAAATPGAGDMPAKGAAGAVTVRGAVDAVDREKGTVTLKGPQGRTVTLQVKDREKLDAVKAGDPVIATYVEAVLLQAKKAGSGTPGMSVQESRVGSKPGETPGGAVGREITVTGTITGIDKNAQTVTVQGPRGNTETIKAEDPRNLDALKVGDLAELTYVQALAVALDKSGQ